MRTALTLLGIAGLAAPGSALAGTITVANTNDTGPGSLRDAVAASASGDTISFDPSLSGQTITLTSGQLTIAHSLTITGLGAGSLTISGNSNSRVFDVDASGGTVTISDLTVTGGMAPSGSSINGDGGGILVESGAFHLTDATVSDNQATGHEIVASGATSGSGGGIANDSASTTTLTGVTVSGNSTQPNATCGGVAGEGAGALVIDSSTISDNSSGYGGGVCTEGGGDVTITDSTISDNTAEDGSILAEGGGFVEDGGGVSTITGSTITGNTADGIGGGVAEDGGGTVEISDSTTTYNDAAQVTGTCTLPNPSYGQPCGSGTNGAGGGLGQDGGGVLDVIASSLVGNIAAINGGAMRVFTGADTITNATMIGNQAGGAGGGVFTGGGFAATTVTLASDTLDSNQSSSATGGNVQPCCNSTLHVHDTILTAGSPVNCNVGGGGTLTSDGHNLSSDATCGLTVAGDQQSTDPQLGSPQNTAGSPPPEYEPLLAASPAIDAGDTGANCPATDEIGQPRPDAGESHCDIGAYEVQDPGGGGGGGGSSAATPPPGTTPAPAPSPVVTVTTLTASAGPAVIGQHVVYAARIAPAPDGGTARFFADGVPIAGCTAVPVARVTGAASCPAVYATRGTHDVVVAYSGDAGFAASRSAPLVERVVSSLALLHVRHGRAGALRLQLRCAAASEGCLTSIVLTARETLRGARVTTARIRRRTVRLASRTLTIAPGRTVTITLRRTRAERRLMARFSRLRVTLRVTLSSGGHRSAIATRRLVV